MRPIVTDRVAWSVRLSVRLSVCHTSEPCKNCWTVETDSDAVRVAGSDGPKEACITWGAHWRHLANTTEPSMCGGDAVFLSDYSDQLFFLFVLPCVDEADWPSASANTVNIVSASFHELQNLTSSCWILRHLSVSRGVHCVCVRL